MSGRGKAAPFAAVAGLVVLLDLVTKAWVVSAFDLYESVPVIDGVFHLTYIRNPGAAFGFLADGAEAFRRPFFLVVTAIALGVILAILRKLQPGRPWLVAGLALIFGGAVGNLVDRVRWGEVVDFLDVFWRSYHWPAFNVADSAITVGISILVVLELFGKKGGQLGG